MHGHKPPVFCVHCPLLALAALDGEPTCSDCLLAVVQREGVEALTDRIEPLMLEQTDWWRLWRPLDVAMHEDRHSLDRNR